MLEIQYIGEHLLPGRAGHAAVLMSFVAALLSAIAYFMATQRRSKTDFLGWRNIGRLSFFIHGISVFAVIGLIFFMMVNQYYEYHYVWSHVSEDLPFRYIFSAFWEGQEGSFLLWMFWHVVLGWILIFNLSKARKKADGTLSRKNALWEAPVLANLAWIQVFINSMILGIYVGWGEQMVKIGSSPMLLLREVMNAPIFNSADYLSLIKGNGLNPLLQNYWMTIHPPTLFLGFASVSIPFCFAVAALWLNKHKEWIQPVLPWALFSGAILGTGILMGGAWAYEALSFGGYWAWDPVENMSLVPWLVLLAGIHTNVIARSTSYSIASTYFFYLLSFLLILYSTFLTRSGILGDTSVHAFTEMGLENQLLSFILFFTFLSFIVFLAKYKNIPSPKEEEPFASREFWMFIGALVLLFSATLITVSTSLPVYNKIRELFDPNFVGSVITDPVAHYNKYQLWIGVFIGLLSGIAQYLRYKEHNFKKVSRKFFTHGLMAMGIAALLTYLTTFWLEIRGWPYLLLLFCGIFSVVSNLDYLMTYLKANLKVGASALAHLGFGIMIVGIIATGLNQHHISSNPFAMEGLIEGATAEDLQKNILLMKKTPMFMSGYEVTYMGDTTIGFTRTFDVNYKRKNEKGELVEDFTLQPNILYDKNFSKIAASNPSTKHYWHKDVFTHIPSLPIEEMDAEARQALEDSLKYVRYEVPLHQPFKILDTTQMEKLDTFIVKEYIGILESITRNPTHPDYHPEVGDLTLGARLRFQKDTAVFYAEPMLSLRGQLLYSFPVKINELTAKVRLSEQAFEYIFTPEDSLDYQEFTFKQGDQITFEGLNITFAGFNKNPEHPNYKKQADDIAVSAMLRAEEDGKNYVAQPLYLIRNSRPFNLKDEIADLGLHLRFVGIDPVTETVKLMMARHNKTTSNLPIEIATNAYRSDWIVLEAIVFPGINLFWLGSVLMMLGLGLGMWRRII